MLFFCFSCFLLLGSPGWAECIKLNAGNIQGGPARKQLSSLENVCPIIQSSLRGAVNPRHSRRYIKQNHQFQV